MVNKQKDKNYNLIFNRK